jgi:hypothetical protein
MAGVEDKPGRKIFGYVLQPGTGHGIAGAIVRVYRQAGDNWQRLATLATDALGYWEFTAPDEPVDAIRVTEENPPNHGDGGWPTVPLGALVRGLNAVHWPQPDLSNCGPIIFYDLSFKLIARLCARAGVS